MATALTKPQPPPQTGASRKGGKSRHDSLSTFMGLRSELLDKTQSLEESDYGSIAKPVKAPTPAVPLDQFNYEDLEQVQFLASGAFSHVFQAIYRGKKVVVKLLREQYKESHVTLRQMRFEQTLLSQLHHQYIVEFIGTGVYNGIPFTVLEKLSETLNHRISGDEKLDMADVLHYAKMIGEALIYIHEGALPGQITLHRDLKPDNLAFDDQGNLKLIDFGLAKSVPEGTSIDEVYEMTGETGSLRYMAPEVASGMNYNAKADVYSLSLITWQMAQGTKPFQGMSRKEFFHHVVHRHFRPPIDPRWPQGLRTLIEHSWDPDHTRRPTARQYVAAIDEIASSISRHRRNSTQVPSSLQSKVRSMFKQVLGGGNGGTPPTSSNTTATVNTAPISEAVATPTHERRSSGQQQQSPQDNPAPPQRQPVVDGHIHKEKDRAVEVLPAVPVPATTVTAPGHKRRNSL